ncbi:pentatricopeptide repeat-containing protein At3g09040, mitochondrial-like [Selaginella moellendorffii]|uniref:pentatricopeptide repeat-containing protein At3g09040, mitochondrial-like n=1 Tax=Selaginella moellendorffii TaxID=88036 RepID=UPI000D1C5242|nr:pentatricopeptide repeat-containing protein At3g09040, mitochondrial-like [Selaginella moellendorffii]|eukprot:XP_024516131.1 pentatricopeptide repeat-containing protein At3g09040, mitochondrial-like [Selaginella moellendorffii]
MVASTLVDMYARCSTLVDARRVFDCMPCRTLMSLNVLLLGYAENNEVVLGLDLFSQLMAGSDAPDARSFVTPLKACALVVVKEDGHKVDGKLVKVKAMEAGMATPRAFDKIPAQALLWTSLILGYSEDDEPQLTLELFSQMRHFQILPNAQTFMGVHKVGGVRTNGSMDGECLTPWFLAMVSWTALMLGYTENSQPQLVSQAATQRTVPKCSSVRASWEFQMPDGSIITWNTGHRLWQAKGCETRLGSLPLAMVQIPMICVLGACSHGSGKIFPGDAGFVSDPVHRALPLHDRSPWALHWR